MTVFAVHEVLDDLSAAHKFGEIRYVNRYYIHGDELERGLLSPDSGDWTIPNGYRVNMERAVAEFNPEADYLLIAGDHLQLLALAAMLTARHSTFMVLRYDRKIKDYIPVRLHSGLATIGGRVVGLSHIGENIHGQDRNQGNAEAERLQKQSSEPRSTEWVKSVFGKRP
jgi:hypothetical protein